VSFIDCFVWPIKAKKTEDSESRPLYTTAIVFCHSGPFHTTPEKLENGSLTLKTLQTFSVHIKPEEFKNGTITGHFGYVFEENSVWEIT